MTLTPSEDVLHLQLFLSGHQNHSGFCWARITSSLRRHLLKQRGQEDRNLKRAKNKTKLSCSFRDQIKKRSQGLQSRHLYCLSLDVTSETEGAVFRIKRRKTIKNIVFLYCIWIPLILSLLLNVGNS